MAYATLTDVTDRYDQTLDETLERIVNVRLGDAERLIKTRIKDLDDQVVAGTIDPEAIAQVEAEMVLRLIRNPEGFSQESDGNYSYAIYQRVASGYLEVLDNEWLLLGVNPGMFMIEPNLERLEVNEPPGVWVPWVF